MEKNYDHNLSESKTYNKWLESGVFTPPAGELVPEGQKTFTVIMPPPNANDPLHVGHAMFVTIEDIFVRFHRMLGDATLWLPGTDHAGIETQFVFEKKLAKQGKSRFDFDRETLFKLIKEYVNENSGVAIDQMKKLGASADWSRYKFTLDEDVVSEVLKTFIKLNDRKLVYKAEKLVNYCTKCGTAYSELEVEHEEREDKIYTIDYGNGIRVATTRPETMFGDVAVAVNPTDDRYKDMVGKMVIIPLVNREIPVVTDEMVDVNFGTGAVKITPTHDPNDWAVAERQNMNLSDICNLYKVIGENGKMTDRAGVYAGMTVLQAREKIVADLGESLLETKLITHSVGTCYRCKRILEPLPRSQFFIKVKSMAEKVIKALDNNEVEIIGSGHDKILRHWLNNLRDWNVSRQIVWGIQMPVWYKKENYGGDDYVVSVDKPEGDYIQEQDTFDTWFSSGQWPFVALMTNKEGDFEKYYPTTMMETAYDILPFWVMRMLMLGLEITGEIPFKKVYLHGLVRDEKGDKMSKSKGNVINPLDLSAKYGTDALRMALVMSTAAGVDSSTGENKVRGMRNFANKIWNAGRFVKMVIDNEIQVNETNFTSKTNDAVDFSETSDKKIGDSDFFEELNGTIKGIEKFLSEYKVGMAAEIVYQDFWHNFCDKAIEDYKKGVVSKNTITEGFKTFLQLLHPFTPYVTEQLWEELYPGQGLLAESSWPKQ